MKILLTGDQHITNRTPKNRTDDYFGTVLYKFTQEMEIAKKERCEIVLLPGDVFDSFKENHLVVQSVIEIIKRSPMLRVYCVAGQHDQIFHNIDLSGTALKTLISAGVVKILSNIPIQEDGISLYGASWNEEIPEIVTPDNLNILVLHKMIIEDKLWAAQENFTWANHMLLKNKFDLVVSGDNHNQFITTIGKKHLVNMGAMMRSSIAQVNHQPAVSIYDSIKQEVKIINLEVKSIEEVMCVAKAEKEKEKNAQLDAFVSSLKEEEVKEGHAVSLNFVDTLTDYAEKNNVDSTITDIIYEAMNEGN